jgi:hypothetical protein
VAVAVGNQLLGQTGRRDWRKSVLDGGPILRQSSLPRPSDATKAKWRTRRDHVLPRLECASQNGEPFSPFGMNASRIKTPWRLERYPVDSKGRISETSGSLARTMRATALAADLPDHSNLPVRRGIAVAGWTLDGKPSVPGRNLFDYVSTRTERGTTVPWGGFDVQVTA